MKPIMLLYWSASLGVLALLGMNIYALVEPPPLSYPSSVFEVDKEEYVRGERITYFFSVCVKRDISYDINVNLENIDQNITYELPRVTRHRTKGCVEDQSSPRFLPIDIIVPGTYRFVFIAHPRGYFKSFNIVSQTETFTITDGEPVVNRSDVGETVRRRLVPQPTPENKPPEKETVKLNGGDIPEVPTVTATPPVTNTATTPQPTQSSTPTITPLITIPPLTTPLICIFGICRGGD